jgi:hypothetical protein
MAYDLRSQIAGEEFDYLALLHALREYARPRDRISGLLRQGEIVRVKKGIYVFGERHAERPFSREVLANLIYGPSYLSHEWALYHHGFIAERPPEVTSTACGRPRRFSTPIGLFVYRPLPLRAYRVGIDLAATDGGLPFLVATPEKALADKVHDERGTALQTLYQMKAYLLDRLGIAPEKLSGLDVGKFGRIAPYFGSRKIRLLHHLIGRIAGGKEKLP